MDMAINLNSVELGKNNNHLIFKGYVPRLSTFYKYEFDFIGTEVMSTSGMTVEQLERLEEKLVNDYGYAPFDITNAKKVLGTGKQYMIEV